VCGGRRPASGGRRPAGGVRRPVCGTERPASGVWRAGYWMEGAGKLSIQGVWGTIVSSFLRRIAVNLRNILITETAVNS